MASGSAVYENEVGSGRQVILETHNTLDLSTDELAPLAAQFQELMALNGLGDVPVTVKGDDPLGAGNHWFDVLHIILPNTEVIKDDVFKGMIALAVAYMKTRFKRKDEETRPRQIKVRMFNGRKVLEVTINGPDDDPEYGTPSDDG
jgi:hypothetical protein